LRLNERKKPYWIINDFERRRRSRINRRKRRKREGFNFLLRRRSARHE